MQIVITEPAKSSGSSKLMANYRQKINLIAPDTKVLFAAAGSADFYTKAKLAEIVVAMATEVIKVKNFPHLKWLHLTSAGANALSQEIIESDILVTNSSGVHPVPISEHVLGLMLMLARGLHKAVKVQVTKKKWMRDINYYQPSELAGKKLLVVGMGRIGERVARLGQAFEMNVVGIVRNPAKHPSNAILKSSQDLSKEVKKADYIVNCLPSTSETIGLFNKTLLNNLKSGSFFINIGRGDTVDERALIAVLKSGKMAGAGLDVFEKEPLSTSSQLWELDNVIITPHYSGANPDYFERMMEIFLVNFKAYIQKKSLPNLVNKKLGY